MSHAFLGKNRIAVLDFGGQYAHLIASRLRRLNAFSEIVYPDEFRKENAREFSGIILSGGPASVYDSDAPDFHTEILESGLPILGICYGHQLLMKKLGGDVIGSESREYGPARLKLNKAEKIFHGQNPEEQPTVWMSHGDEVRKLPAGFSLLASTEDCLHAAVAKDNVFGVQFHPEVTETAHGKDYLLNFIEICGLKDSWTLEDFLAHETERIASLIKDRKVFFLVSGGVDSSVAFSLLGRAIPHEDLVGLFVDTGFMRKNESSQVQNAFSELGIELKIHDASDLYYKRLENIYDPEEKRKIIGELFIEVQRKACSDLGLNPDEWFLGQGTIYPDTIESGGTKSSHKIKTHHNRVEAIARLIEAGRVVEPVSDLYKDEVRNLGRLLELPETLVGRHPFPGPGLAVRVLCTGKLNKTTPEGKRLGEEGIEQIHASLLNAGIEAEILPVQSVGVQGDKRSYAHPVALYSPVSQDFNFLSEIARALPNRRADVNRVVLRIDPLSAESSSRPFQLLPERYLTPERVETLRTADALVTEFMVEKNIYHEIWQCPVVLLPVAPEGVEGESIVIRPVNSIDAMTAVASEIKPVYLTELAERLKLIAGIAAVFYDLTSKPPGTIEWE